MLFWAWEKGHYGVRKDCLNKKKPSHFARKGEGKWSSRATEIVCKQMLHSAEGSLFFAVRWRITALAMYHWATQKRRKKATMMEMTKLGCCTQSSFNHAIAGA